MLLLTLRGTPTMYYGDEIGMARVDVPRECVHDPWEKNEPGLGVGRDPWRTPMQWDVATNGGFSAGRPWLPLAPDYTVCNVMLMHNDPRSILSLYRDLIAIRRTNSALIAGHLRVISATNNVLVYARTDSNQRIIVALNFGDKPQPLPIDIAQARPLLSTHMDRDTLGSPAYLRDNEGLILIATPRR
jgi:alpha-glucosidase